MGILLALPLGNERLKVIKFGFERTTGASNGALARRIGKAKAEMTIPVVMKVQKSFSGDDALMSSTARRPINVGSGDKT